MTFLVSQPQIPGPGLVESGLIEVDEAELKSRLSQLSLEQKAALLHGAGFWSLQPIPAIGLRQVTLSDGPNGVRGFRWGDENDLSALFPAVAGLAASWDEGVLVEVGTLLGQEARRKGVDVLLGPGVNLHRSPLGGRNFEYFSEDPLLTSHLAAAYIRGVHSQGVGTCTKHFVLNETENERFTYDVEIEERALRELYLTPFEAAIAAGTTSVMAAYNRVSGQSMTTHARLNDQVLKGEWAYDGALISDWTAARDKRASILGGLDLAMPGPDADYGRAVVEGVLDGTIPEAVVDDHVLRILRLAARVGGFAEAPPAGADRPSEEVNRQIRRLTARTMTLLRNAPVNGRALLPLQTGGGVIGVIGPAATAPACNGGGSASVTPVYTVSPLQGLREALGDDAVIETAQGAVSRKLLPSVDPKLFSAPDGAAGVRLQLLDQAGKVLFEETRRNSRGMFVSGFDPNFTDEVAEIRIDTKLKADNAGDHRLGISGAGKIRLVVGEQPEQIVEDPACRPGSFEQLFGASEILVPLPLERGESVDICISKPVLPEERGKFVSLGLGYARPQPDDDQMIAQAVALARRADRVLLFVGTTEEIEMEHHDRHSLRLPGRQDDLVEAVLAANPRTVVVINAAAPVLMPWIDRAAAVLWSGFGGQDYGRAVADVLLGVEEPAGRLPTTFPASPEDAPVLDTMPAPDGKLAYGEGLHLGYRGYDAKGTAPLFAFGHGLGYAAWQYRTASVSVQPRPNPADLHSIAAEVSVLLTNIADRRGREVIQIYADAIAGDDNGAPQSLVGFTVVEAEPGETVEARIAVAARALARYGRAGWELPSGLRTLHIARSSRDRQITVRVDFPHDVLP